MNPWDAIDPKDLEGWKPIDDRELTPEDLDWMKKQVDVPAFDTDSDPGDENGN